jgi:macrolide transport system ATP-binding/permease protein
VIRTFFQDLRHGARLLARNPGFALIAILSIGVGVGATTAMFSLADGLLLRPLAVERPAAVLSIVGEVPEGGFGAARLSYLDFRDIRDRSRTFENLVASRDVLTAFDARPGQPAMRTLGAAVTANMFDVMGLRPTIGRFFRPDEDVVPGRDAVVVLDHRTWTERFAGDPQVVGRRVRIGSGDFTVVGVGPASFRGLSDDVWPAFYIPTAMIPDAMTPRSTELTRRDARGFEVKGRLRPAVTIEQANAEIATITSELARAYPETNRGQRLSVKTELQLRLSGPDASLVTMMLALAATVLAVACANVAGLLTSRAPVRARELATKLAVGAKRGRLVRQLLTESLLVAGGGAAVGVGIAYGAVSLFQQLEFPTEVPLKLYFEIDQRVLVVGVVVAVLSAVIASVIPAWQATRQSLIGFITGAASTGKPSRQWGRHSLVSLQVALSLIVLTVATGLYAGFRARMIEGPGFDPDGVLMMRFDERLTSYDRERATRFYTDLVEQVRGLPGVTTVALTSAVPLKTDTTQTTRVAPEGVRLPGDTTHATVRSSRIDEGYFDILGIPLISGRGVQAGDDVAAPRVAVVTRAFVNRYWPGEDAVGKRLNVRAFGATTDEWHEIVGVAEDTKHDWLAEPPLPFVYFSRRQGVSLDNTLMVRTAAAPATLADPLRELVQSIAPEMPVFGVRTMADLYQSRGLAVPTLIVRIVAGMGVMALVLALVGLYGLVAYAVSRRTREIGIRMAVGAQPRSILRLMLNRSVVMTIAGLAVGTVGSIAAAGALAGILSGIGRFNVVGHGLVTLAVLVVAVAAALIPARRAARIDPLRALRIE